MNFQRTGPRAFPPTPPSGTPSGEQRAVVGSGQPVNTPVITGVVSPIFAMASQAPSSNPFAIAPRAVLVNMCPTAPPMLGTSQGNFSPIPVNLGETRVVVGSKKPVGAHHTPAGSGMTAPPTSNNLGEQRVQVKRP